MSLKIMEGVFVPAEVNKGILKYGYKNATFEYKLPVFGGDIKSNMIVTNEKGILYYGENKQYKCVLRDSGTFSIFTVDNFLIQNNSVSNFLINKLNISELLGYFEKDQWSPPECLNVSYNKDYPNIILIWCESWNMTAYVDLEDEDNKDFLYIYTQGDRYQKVFTLSGKNLMFKKLDGQWHKLNCVINQYENLDFMGVRSVSDYGHFI